MTYLLERWYCAGWSALLTDKPIGRKMFDRPVVMYRDEAGAVVALGGACPHRFAPLAKGEVIGDKIICPYHGLEFDRNGVCVRNPHGERIIPPNAKVASYPVMEKNGIIWIWPGDTAEADESLILDAPWILSPEYAVRQLYLRVNANYQLIIDNLLDLTHAPYVHANTLGNKSGDTAGKSDYDFHMEGTEIVHSNYFVRGLPHPSPSLIPIWGDRPGDFRAEMRWLPAANLELHIRMSPEGAEKAEGLHSPSLHLLLPESETVTHYFFFLGRNMLIDNEELSEFAIEIARKAFEEEDEPMVRACQEMMGTTDLLSLQPAILQTDVAAMQARRVLDKMIRSVKQAAK